MYDLIPSPLSLLLPAVLVADWLLNRRALIWYAGPVALILLVAFQLGEHLFVDVAVGGGVAGLLVLLLVRLPFNWLTWRYQRTLWVRALGGSGCDDPQLVGRRAANLTALRPLGHPIPGGLVVTTAALWEFITHSRAEEELVSLARRGRDAPPEAIVRTAAVVSDALDRDPMPWLLRRALGRAARHLLRETDGRELSAVASHTDEIPARDRCLAPAPAAGPAAAEREVIRAVRRMWRSHFTAGALECRIARGGSASDPGLAVMLSPVEMGDWRGLIASHDPTGGDACLVESRRGESDPKTAATSPVRQRLPWHGDRRPLRPAGEPAAESPRGPTQATVKRLAQLARAAAHALGGPAWLEWCLDAHGGISVTDARVMPLAGSEGATISGPWVRGAHPDLFHAEVTPLVWSHFEPALNQIPPRARPRSPDGTQPMHRIVRGHVHTDLGALHALASVITREDSTWPLDPRRMRSLRRQMRRLRRRIARHPRALRRIAQRDLTGLPGELLADELDQIGAWTRWLHAPAAQIMLLRQVVLDRLSWVARRHYEEDVDTLIHRLVEPGVSPQERDWRMRWAARLGSSDREFARRAVPLLREVESLLRAEQRALLAHLPILAAWLEAARHHLGAGASAGLEYLTVSEITEGLRRPSERLRWPQMIAERRRDWVVDEDELPEPLTLDRLGRPVSPRTEVADRPADEDVTDLLIQGDELTFASPGTVEGPVRHLDDPEHHGAVMEGEILVAPHADRRWAGSLDRARAMVFGQGGVLDDLACACRDCGVVMAIADRARSSLADQQRLRISAQGIAPRAVENSRS